MSRIEDLDEFQGLTPQMVREWLCEQGFDMRLGGLLHAGRYLVEWEPIESAWRSTEASLYAIAGYRNQSVQSLLREINPREREGVPSEAARQAHPGNWLVSGCLNQSKEMHFEVWHSRNLHLASNYPYNPDGKRIACWPLDEHGSKVRWPVDDEGKML